MSTSELSKSNCGYPNSGTQIVGTQMKDNSPINMLYTTEAMLHHNEDNGLSNYIDGLVQDCSNSSALVLELLQSCAKSLIWFSSSQQLICAIRPCVLTQQHAVTVICMVLRPGWHTSFKYSGLCDVLFSPRSIQSGLALTDTVTEAGQFVFIWRSSWWKHFSCNSRSDLKNKSKSEIMTSET